MNRRTKEKTRKENCVTEEAAVGFIGVVDGALDEILVEAGAEVVGLHLAGHVVAVNAEGAAMQAHLLYRLQRLHLRALVDHVPPHRHRLSGNRLLSLCRSRTG